MAEELGAFLTRGGLDEEFGGKAQALLDAVGANDLSDLLDLVEEVNDLRDLYAAGFRVLHVKKLFRAIAAERERHQGPEDTTTDSRHAKLPRTMEAAIVGACLSTTGLIEAEESTTVTAGLRAGVFEVSKEGPIWSHLAAIISESVPDVEVISVGRVWNQYLWEEYARNMAAPHRQRDPRRAKRVLAFHGAAPEKLSSVLGLSLPAGSNTSGFDPKHGNAGVYSAAGCGVYFAKHAVYPLRIHPKAWEGSSSTLLVAEVLVGDGFSYGPKTDPTRTSLPARADGELYDSVSGSEDGIGSKHVHGGEEDFGTQHVLFARHLAYPHFIVRVAMKAFRIVNTVSNRVLYASVGKEWSKGRGAARESDLGSDRVWWRISLKNGTYRIINAKSWRVMYAGAGGQWGDKVGAGVETGVGPDGTWDLIPSGAGHRMVNNCTKRALYAKCGENGEDGFGAGPDHEVGEHGVWRFERAELES